MIKFFRNIRKKLLAEGKTTNYLKYAIGEIVLVVIGILIALQINNWNENRLKNNTVKTYLINLIQDIKDDQDKLNFIYNSYLFKYHSMQYLLIMANAAPFDPIADGKNMPSFNKNFLWETEIPQEYNKEFIQLAFTWSHRTRIYEVYNSTINELKSTGLYSYINHDLKIEINGYYEGWDVYFKDINHNLAEDWQVSLAKDGFITSDTYRLDDPLSLIKNNQKRIGLLKRMIREAGFVIQGVTSIREKNKSLMNSLQNEISKI